MALQKDSSYWQFCRKTSLQVQEVLTVGLASVVLLLQATCELGQLGMLLGPPASSLRGGFSAGPEPGLEEVRLAKVTSSTRTPTAPSAEAQPFRHTAEGPAGLLGALSVPNYTDWPGAGHHLSLPRAAAGSAPRTVLGPWAPRGCFTSS